MIENTLDFPVERAAAEVLASIRTGLDLGESPVVVYTGTLEPYQGIDLLVEASRSVIQQMPQVRFVMVGGTAAQVAELRRHADRVGAGHAFRWVPPVPPDEVPRYLQLADVLVTPRARGTNTPLKIYQYLRAGRPIVATAIRSHTQVLDASLAELVAPEPVALADGLVRVLRDTAYAMRLAEAGARAASDRYSEQRYLEKLDDLLGRLTRPSGA